MKKITILIPQQEFLNSYRGGAVAKWIDDVYGLPQSKYKFYILGRILKQKYDFKNNNFSSIVSRYNGLMNIITKTPVIRHLAKPFVSSIYVKIYKNDILDSEVLEVHNSFEYIAKIRKYGFTGKIILHMHNNYLEGQNKKTVTMLDSQIDLLIFPSNALKKDFLSNHPYFAKMIRIIPGGYNPQKFFPKEKSYDMSKPIIGYIGRFDSNKNILNLLDIYVTLLKKIPTLEFYLIGSGKSGGVQNKYQKLVLEKVDYINRKNGKITYLGYVHNDELVNYYNMFDIFVSLPVKTEALGMTFIEALACKTISIGTNLGGIPEAIGSKALLIDDPKNHDEVTERIFHILSDVSLQQALREETFDYVSLNFQWQVIQKKQLKALDFLLNRESGNDERD